MTRNKAHQFCALLLLLAGMLVGCDTTNSEIPNDILQGEVTKDFVKDCWTMDLDGTEAYNASTIIIDLKKKEGKTTVNTIDIMNDSIIKFETPIKSWDIISDFKGFKDVGLTGHAIKIEYEDTTHYYVIKRCTRDSIIAHSPVKYGNETVIAQLNLVRKDSPKNRAQEINMTNEQVSTFCDMLRTASGMNDKFTNNTASSGWMANLSDGVLLRNVAIPGTHDSSTNDVSYFVDFAALTQNFAIKDQFNMGVRSFDLRVRDRNDDVELCHGPIPNNLLFKEAFETIVNAVAGTKECAFIFINTESNPFDGHYHIRNMVNTFFFGQIPLRTDTLNEKVTRQRVHDQILSITKTYKAKGMDVIGYYHPDITMGEARGKVFIINRLPSKEKGTFPFVGQGIIGNFSGIVDLVPDDAAKHPVVENAMKINDAYAPKGYETDDDFIYRKSNEFKSLVELGYKQRTSNESKMLIFNSASGSVGDESPFDSDTKTELPNYAFVSNVCYPKFIDNINKSRTCGLIVQDYAGSNEVTRVSLKAVTNAVIVAVSALPFPFPWLISTEAMLGVTILKAATPATKVYGYDLLNTTIASNFIDVPAESASPSTRVIEGKKGDKIQLWVDFTPADAGVKYREVLDWTTDDPSVATVSANGLVEIKKYGNARITAHLSYGLQTTAYVVAAQTPITALDLGLSVDWGNRNLGAAMPENTGFIYAWGDTKLRDDFTPERYLFGADAASYTKYCAHDGLKILQSSDDAATATLGAEWRMPTIEEVQELFRESEVIAMERNGIQVLQLKRNGITMYLPETGYYKGYDLQTDEREGYFWTSNVFTNSATEATNWEQANCMYLNIATKWFGGTMNTKRYYGMPIRPVRKKK